MSDKNLEAEFVWQHILPDSEACLEVLLQHVNFSHSSQYLLIDDHLTGLFRRQAILALRGWLSCLHEEVSGLGRTLLYDIACRPLEVFVVDGVEVDAGQLNTRRCRNDVSLVYALEGYTIELIRASNQKQTGRELLEEHHTLATEPSGQEDEHRSRRDRFPEFCDLRPLGVPDEVLLFIVRFVIRYLRHM